MFISAIERILFAMKAERVELNELEMYYETEGIGEPLLLLHGGTGCHDDWAYAGRDRFVREYAVIAPDARGHGRTSNPHGTITHRQCALDTLALLDRLGISTCRAVGLSMGGNILLHMATMQLKRIEAMVVVSATMYFPEQARATMRQVPEAEKLSCRTPSPCCEAFLGSTGNAFMSRRSGRTGCRVTTKSNPVAAVDAPRAAE